MALILIFHNLSDPKKPIKPISDYDVSVRINEYEIANGKVLKHKRDKGWKALVQKWLDQVED